MGWRGEKREKKCLCVLWYLEPTYNWPLEFRDLGENGLEIVE